MFKKLFSSVLLLTFCMTLLQAQNGVKADPEIRKLKIDFVTSKMNMTAQQESKFLPLYNRYSDELLVYRRKIKQIDKGADNASFKVKERQRMEEEMVAIKGRYQDAFLKVISPQQLNAMYEAEGAFKDILLEYLKKKGK